MGRPGAARDAREPRDAGPDQRRGADAARPPGGPVARPAALGCAILIVLAATLPTGAQKAGPVPTGVASARLSGTVMAEGRRREAAKDALVLLAGVDIPLVRTTAADDKGHFTF